MEQKHIETEMSKKARQLLEVMISSGEIRTGTPYFDRIKRTAFDPIFRENYDEGKITKKRLVEVLSRSDYTNLSLACICVELNLEEKDAREMLESFYRFNYGPESIFDYESGTEREKNILKNGKRITTKNYPEHCRSLCITPREDFPDW